MRRRRKRGRAEERRCPGRGKRVCTTWLFSLTRKSRSISTERFATAMPHFTERALIQKKDNPFPHFCRDSYRKVSEIFCLTKFLRIGCHIKIQGLMIEVTNMCKTVCSRKHPSRPSIFFHRRIFGRHYTAKKQYKKFKTNISHKRNCAATIPSPTFLFL
jgi:hypothetical protein